MAASIHQPTTPCGSPVAEPPASTETSPTDGVEASPDDPDDDSQVEVRSFENLLPGSNETQPLIALVNLSTVPLDVIVGADSLFPDAILPTVVSDYASIALESTRLGVIDGATADPLLILSPLNLGVFFRIHPDSPRSTDESGYRAE